MIVGNGISKFILNNVEKHPSDIIAFVAQEFGISRQRAHVHVSKEMKGGKIVKIGKTKSARYFLVGGKHIEFATKIEANLAEDKVWSKFVKPMPEAMDVIILKKPQQESLEVFS